jgi:hypothetical protein
LKRETGNDEKKGQKKKLGARLGRSVMKAFFDGLRHQNHFFKRMIKKSCREGVRMLAQHLANQDVVLKSAIAYKMTHQFQIRQLLAR